MFSWVEDNKLKYLRIDDFLKFGVKAYFTSRLGGVSTAPYDSLNLALHTDDRKDRVIKNRQLIADSLGINYVHFTVAEQVHSDKVYLISRKDRGAGAINYDESIPGIDALVTKEQGLPLVSFYADCVPVFLADPVTKVVALAHAGWKGTVKKIASKTVSLMEEKCGVNPRNIWAAIGPSISKDFYEVGDSVVKKFEAAFKNYKEFIVDRGKQRYLLDLWQVNINSLLETGVPNEQIILSNYCTYQNNNYFYSYRKEAGRTGRMASIIYL